MKKTTRLLWLFMSIFLLVACNDSFLDETTTTDLDENVVFGDSTYTAGFLTQIYHDIGFDVAPDRFSSHGGLQTACDEAEFRQSSDMTTDMQFATGTINSQTVSDDAWRICYANIRRCNKFLQRVGDSPMAESAKLQYKAEAKFLRAWYYYILLRTYGGVPIIADTVYAGSDVVKTVRDTYADCVDYIAKETNDVINMNVLRPRTSGRSNGRINEACCYALLSRLYLDAASPLHNGSDYGTDDTKELLGYTTYDKERWGQAFRAARSCMTMGGDYRLYEYHQIGRTGVTDVEGTSGSGWGFYAVQFAADFVNCNGYDDFSYPYGAYQEIILQRKAGTGTNWARLFDPVTCGGDRYGGCPYSELADAFPMVDGKPIGESAYPYSQLRPEMYRDPRFMNTIVYDSCVLANKEVPTVIYTRLGSKATQDVVYDGTPTGFYSRKFLHRSVSRNYFLSTPESQCLIRFAELMLNYAEAANEYYGPDFTENLGGQEVGPYYILKSIRSRAGIEAGKDGMYGLKPNMTQEEMREAIRLERRIELAYEGFRFYDVRRWMIAEQTENKELHGLEISDLTGKLEATPFVVRKHVFRKAMYFWPLPYSEVVKSKDLKQNPYYE